jgi:hypothetical protein
MFAQLTLFDMSLRFTPADDFIVNLKEDVGSQAT